MKASMVLAAALLLHAQGTDPRAKVSEYPVQGDLENGFTLTSEYLVHSLPTPNGSLIIDDYLIVEVAFFGPRSTRIKLSAEQFSLSMNGRRISTQAAGSVAAAIRYPAPNFAGPRSAGDTGTEKRSDMPIEDRIEHSALPEGDQQAPIGGLLFFPYHGKMKAIRALDLVYSGPAGKVTLKLL